MKGHYANEDWAQHLRELRWEKLKVRLAHAREENPDATFEELACGLNVTVGELKGPYASD